MRMGRPIVTYSDFKGSGRLPVPVGIYLLCIAVPLTFSVGPLALSTMRLFLLIMVIPLAIQLLRGRYGRIIAPDIFFPLQLVWGAIAFLMNTPEQMIEHIGSLGIEFIGGYLIGRAYIRSPADFFALAKAVVLLITLLLPMTIIEALTNRSPYVDLLEALPGFGSAEKVIDETRLGLYRVQSVLDHPIHFGLFCSMMLSFCYIGLKGVVGTPRRIWGTVVIAVSGFLSLSSGALLAMVLQAFLVCWMWTFSRLRWRWWLLMGIILLGYVTVDLLSNRTPLQVFMSYATFSPHNAYWRSLIFEYGMDNVWANPLFGLGNNPWVRPLWMHTGTVDNFWLVIAMRYGIPGVVLLMIGYVVPLLYIGLRNFDTDPMLLQIRRAWMFSILGMSFTLATVHVWNNAYSAVFFLFGAGMWLSGAVPASGKVSKNEITMPRNDPTYRAPSYTRFPERTASSISRRPVMASNMRNGAGSYRAPDEIGARLASIRRGDC